MADPPLWVKGLRSQLRMTVGPAWRLVEQRGAAKLDVRFQDGSRKTVVLPYRWLPADSRAIQECVEQIAAAVAAGLSLQQALKQIQGGAPAPAAPAPDMETDLLSTWENFGRFKVSTGAIKPTTWSRDYASSAARLQKVAGEAKNAKDLLTAVGEGWPAGARRRQIAVQHVAAMLRWGCDENLLPPDRWTPPSSLRRYVGEALKKPELAKPLTDSQILQLFDQLPKDRPGQRWLFVLQLLAAYGLRPVEAQHLSIREGNQLWCTYQKRSGAGTTKPRQLRPLHPEWEQEWNLLERIAFSEPMPPFGGGVADAARRYLSRQQGWRELARTGITPYGFRHGFALRAHLNYGLAPRITAALMGHSVDTHIKVYGSWTDSVTIDTALEAGLRYRETTSSQQAMA